MQNAEVAISDNFKKMATRAILSIVFFIVVYILLIGFAIGLTIACGYFGLGIVAAHPSFITIVLGIGVASIGVLVLIFLIKFLFSTHKIDRSHLVEIKSSDEPELFSFIQKIVDEVDTDFPKKIYLSSDVNASVFYDSSFWSMFFPIKKNLQIGVGLVNTISVPEFKAILAHEFGHFSQRSMKVGSYVYNVNQVIYNMLYDNESYGSLIQRWANVDGIIALFVMLAVKIVEMIQWILKKVYELVNISYMSLSREMEFHADEVAANVAGSSPLITSLMRLDLANHSLNSTLNFYGGKIEEAVKTQNIFAQQKFVMDFYAKENEVKIENNFPIVSFENLNRYNKSKLVIEDQWASHPSTKDRVTALKKLNIIVDNGQPQPAGTLFKNFESLQQKMTDFLFAKVEYKTEVTLKTKEEFIQEFTSQHEDGSFPEIYNNYYDHWNTSSFDFEEAKKTSIYGLNIDDFFGEKMINQVYAQQALENDIQTLTQITNKTFPIKTFDYDGKKHKQKDAANLISSLTSDLEDSKKSMHENDLKIFNFFYSKAKTKGLENQLQKKYKAYFDTEKRYAQWIQPFERLSEHTQFIQEVLPYEVIREKADGLALLENELKLNIKEMLEDEKYKKYMSESTLNNFNLYLSKDWLYIQPTGYNEDALNILFQSMNDYQVLLNRSYFDSKKDFLVFQEKLNS